jgi:hypothetical protein
LKVARSPLKEVKYISTAIGIIATIAPVISTIRKKTKPLKHARFVKVLMLSVTNHRNRSYLMGKGGARILASARYVVLSNHTNMANLVEVRFARNAKHE